MNKCAKTQQFLHSEYLLCYVDCILLKFLKIVVNTIFILIKQNDYMNVCRQNSNTPGYLLFKTACFNKLVIERSLLSIFWTFQNIMKKSENLFKTRMCHHFCKHHDLKVISKYLWVRQQYGYLKFIFNYSLKIQKQTGRLA